MMTRKLAPALAAGCAFAAHKRIFDAIAARDGDAAESAMRDHLLQLQDAYWAHEAGAKNGMDVQE